MKKSIFVVDEEYQTMGTTYEARAKQLIKKGRAKWVDRQTIAIVGDSAAISTPVSNDMDDYPLLSGEDSFMDGLDGMDGSPIKLSFEQFVRFSESGKNVLLSLLCGIAFSFIWYGVCAGFLDDLLGWNMLRAMYFIPVFALWAVIVLEIILYARKRINQMLDKDDVVFMAAYPDANASGEYNKKLAMYVKERLNRKRKLILHASLYGAVSMVMLITTDILYYDDDFAFILICLWGVAVVMHFIIYKTQITPVQVRREMKKAKSERIEM